MSTELPHTAGPTGAVIFTDLDGTLLDRDSYAFDAARPALQLVRAHGIPLVLCSSKTRAEQLQLRARLDIHDPFIVEDGSAIYIEHGYFAFDFPHERVNDTLGVIKLGPGYDTVRRALAEVRAETGIPLQGYGDIDADTVASITGLSPAAARLARQREFHETIVSRLTNREAAYVAAALASRGLRLTRGGRFFGAGGPGDKGTAVAALAKLFQRKLGPVELVGLGDSHNDVAMLTAVDVAALVQKSDGTWERVPTRGIRRVQGVGPAGWNDFVTHYLTHGAGQSVPRRRVRARADNVRG